MNKLLKPLIICFKAIYYLIDRLIVLPLSRFIYRITELSRANSGRMEKILNRPNILIYVSLICAIVVFLIIDNRAITLVREEAEILSGHPIQVIYNEEAFVVEGIPDTVDITLIGRRSDLFLARQIGEHDVSLDLTGLGVGTHRVRLTYSSRSIGSINYKLYPNVVLVRISERVRRNMSFTYDILNADALDSRLSISSVSFGDRSVVNVQGSEEALANVAAVRALIDLEAAELNERGTFTVSSIVLAAFDNRGNRLTNVEMVPNRISAQVVVDSHRVELPVKIVTTGSLPVGQAIETINSSVSRVTVYGDPTVLENLSYIQANVSLNNLRDNQQAATLIMPSGVRHLSETTTMVTITTGLEISQELSGVLIEPINLGNNYTVQAGTAADQAITVIVTGTESVIRELDASNIVGIVDLSGLSPGTHRVPVSVSPRQDDIRINVTGAVSEVTVIIRTR